MANVHESIGDIFDAAPYSILIHACNARGVWGTGVALEFKKRYPEAFQVYRDHCLARTKRTGTSSHQASLVGTTLLIPPQTPKARRNTKPASPVYIACLFTSDGYGRNVDSPKSIIGHTEQALEDLAVQVKVLKCEGKEISECRAVRINSGRFGVPWERTKKILEDGPLDTVIVRPEHEDAGQVVIVETNHGAGDGSKREEEAADGLRDEDQKEENESEKGERPTSGNYKGHRMSPGSKKRSRKNGRTSNMKSGLGDQPETTSEEDTAEWPRKGKQRKKRA